MKIAHVCPYYEPAICGVKQVVKEIALRQIREGNEVHIYTSDWDKTKRIEQLEEIIEGIHVHRSRHWFKIGAFATFWPQVFFKLFFKRYNVIHTHVFGHPHFVLAALVAFLKNEKHIHTTHCPWTDSNRSRLIQFCLYISYNFFSRIAIISAKNIIAITPWEVKYIQKYGGDKKKIIIIPNGVDKKFFLYPTSNYFEEKYGIKGRVILNIGRLNITKGPDKFIEIAKIVLKEKNDVNFIWIGPDEGMKQKIVEMSKDEPRIKILEAIRDRDEINKIYHSTYIYLLTSFREGLPLTLMEALASGLPIVSTPVNGIPYEIKNNINGYLINYGENEKFKEKILYLLNNQEKRDKIANDNKEYAKKYNWDKIFNDTMKLYI